MYANQMIKQMVVVQKEVLEDCFSRLVAVQEFVEKITRFFYEQAIWYPEESMRAFNQWTRSCKTGRDQMKMLYDRNVNRIMENI